MMLDGFLYVDLNGYMDHLHDNCTWKNHDKKNLDLCDVLPKWLTANKPVRALTEMKDSLKNTKIH